MGSVFKCVDVNIRFVCMALWALPVNNAGRNVRVYRGADHALLHLLGARCARLAAAIRRSRRGLPVRHCSFSCLLARCLLLPRKIVLVGHVNSD